MIGAFLSRAASRAATAVEDDVTFYSKPMSVLLLAHKRVTIRTYNGGNSKVVFLSILEESQDVIADDDTSLAGENILDTHFG